MGAAAAAEGGDKGGAARWLDLDVVDTTLMQAGRPT
jgi:hypothetical protein